MNNNSVARLLSTNEEEKGVLAESQANENGIISDGLDDLTK